jgi:hypothetical protein
LVPHFTEAPPPHFTEAATMMLVAVSVGMLYLIALMSFFGAAILHYRHHTMLCLAFGTVEFLMATALALFIAFGR